MRMLHQPARPTGCVAHLQSRHKWWLEREKEQFQDWKVDQEAALQTKWEELRAEEKARRQHLADMDAKVWWCAFIAPPVADPGL